MLIETSELTAQVLALVAKLYPNGTTLTVINGQVEVKLPEAVKAKKVLPPVVKKTVWTPRAKKVFINDATVEWDGYEQFFLNSESNKIFDVPMVILPHDLQYFIEMLRGEGKTEDLEFEVYLTSQDGQISYAEY
jgi:hypothetical protein